MSFDCRKERTELRRSWAKIDYEEIIYRFCNTKTSELSDGFHTFKELYHHRYALFALLCNLFPSCSYKSKIHFDGTQIEGLFIAHLNLGTGDMSYHIPLKHWDDFNVIEREKAEPFDGHTSLDVINRLWQANNKLAIKKKPQ